MHTTTEQKKKLSEKIFSDQNVTNIKQYKNNGIKLKYRCREMWRERERQQKTVFCASWKECLNV